jgi:hypothetical protein
MMLCAYVLSIFVVERLFKIVKPKLLTLPWFAVIWRWSIAARRKLVAWLHRKPIFRRKSHREHRKKAAGIDRGGDAARVPRRMA